jgi:MFS family permease
LRFPRLDRLTLLFVCASVILTVAFSVRHAFGLFLQPMSMANGWGREVFGFAIALQNLVWGFAQPLTGMLADRFGAGRVLAAGGVIYVLGLVLMAESATPLALALSVGVVLGLAMSCVTFNVVYSALGRGFPPERHSAILGTTGAVVSFGQFTLLPLVLVLISGLGWYWALIVLAAMSAVAVPAAFGVSDRGYGTLAGLARQPLKAVIAQAFERRGFWLLSVGYFTCGFQIVFIGTHLPAYLLDQGLSAADGSICLALIGLFNAFGSWLCGYLGGRMPKTYILSALYATRGVATAALISFPVTPLSAYLFSAVIGITWLGTVPLTAGVVAGIFGVRHMAMLTGIVFLFHQVGSFFGGWLGGYLFDETGSYQTVWLIAIGLSVVSTLVNLPIDERPIARADRPAPA